MNEVVIKKDKIKQIGLLLACVIFVYIGYHMVANDFGSSRYSPEFVRFFGMIGIVFFGFGGVVILYNLLSSKSALTLSTSGIMNNSHIGGGYLIRWENIKSLKIISVNKQLMIEIQLKNREEIYSQVNGFARRWMKLNDRFMGTPTFIPAVMMKMKLDDVLKVILEQKKINTKAKMSITDDVNINSDSN